MSFAQVLYNLRTSRGLSQQELSDALGGRIKQSTIGLYEVGKRDPRRENVKMLAEYFHVPVSAFYVDTNPTDQDLVNYIVDRMHSDPEYRTLFEVSRNVKSSDLAAVNQILKSIARERDDE